MVNDPDMRAVDEECIQDGFKELEALGDEPHGQ
jgi:hypothetical protein